MNSLKQKTRALFKDLNADAVLLRTNDAFPDSSLSYFTGLPKPFLSGNILILRPGKTPVLLKSILEPKISVPGLSVKRIDRKKQLAQTLKTALKGTRRLAVNRPFYTSASLRDLKKLSGRKKLVDVSKRISAMRTIKSDSEISSISKACKIAQKVSEAVPAIFRKGMTEKQLALEIEFLLREKGENFIPFPVIAASGKNAAFPHHVPLKKKISRGLLLLDFGACYKNYCSDVTRVFSVGKPSKRQVALYASVFAAKQFAQSLIRPGTSQAQVFKQADAFLKKETGLKLIHGLGHGLGVDVHDFPAGFLKENRQKLEKGMVLTVEPGLYGKFGGIRVEDDIVVTAKGCKPFTRAPAELIRLA